MKKRVIAIAMVLAFSMGCAATQYEKARDKFERGVEEACPPARIAPNIINIITNMFVDEDEELDDLILGDISRAVDGFCNAVESED